MGMIEVDLFTDEVDSEVHPEAEKVKILLEAVAAEFGAELLAFEVNQGTVAFSFDRDELTAEVLKLLRNE
jgi:hypothetical protein